MTHELSSLSTIFVPLDGSPLGELALPYAERLARATGASLLLARVASLAHVQPVAELHAYLDGTARRVGQAGLSVRTSVLVGDAAQAILDEVTRRAAQLLVVATHTRSGASRWRFGDVAEPLLVHATVPVLLIPEIIPSGTWPEDRPLTMLVPLDGSTWSEAILTSATDLAGWIGAELVLLDVVDPAVGGQLVGDPAVLLTHERAYIQQVAGHLQSTSTPVRVRVELGRPARTINRLAHDEHVDVIAMATHGRGSLARLVLGSVVAEVLEHADVPLLLVRPMAPRDEDANSLVR